MIKTTKPQRQSIKRLWVRQCQSKPQSYRAFRKTVQPGFMGEYIMVPFAGMIMGIEKDGHTHS